MELFERYFFLIFPNPPQDSSTSLLFGPLDDPEREQSQRNSCVGFVRIKGPLHKGSVKENLSCEAVSRVPKAPEGFHSRRFIG